MVYYLKRPELTRKFIKNAKIVLENIRVFKI